MSTTGPNPPGGASGWTNSSNALATDGAVATAGYSGSTDGGGVFTPVSTSDLLLSTFGISIGAGDAPVGFSVSVKARRQGSPPAKLYAYLLTGSTPKGSTKELGALTTSLAVYTGGGTTDLWGASWTGAEANALKIAVYVSPTGDGSSTAEVDSVTVTLYWNDQTPTAFSFTDVTGQARDTYIASNAITVAGVEGLVPVSVSGDYGVSQWDKNDNNWSNLPGTAANGESLRCRGLTKSGFSQTTNTTLTVGAGSDIFSITTLAADTTPDAFSLNDVTGVEPNTMMYSNSITVAGINSAAAISVSSGEYSVNGGAYTASAGNVNNGDVVTVRKLSSVSYSTLITMTLTIGGVSDAYETTTRAADTTPNLFTFTDQGNVATSTVFASNVITITGIEAAASVSFSSSGFGSSFEYRKNGGGYGALGANTVNASDTLQVRMTSSASNGQTGNITMTVGGVSDTFSVTTISDPLPNAFSFSDKINVIPGDPGPHDSGEAQITGIDVTVTANATYCDVADNVATPISAGYVDPDPNVANNDYIELRTKSTAPIPKCGQQTLTIPVTVGTGTSTWLIKTKPGMPAGQVIT